MNASHVSPWAIRGLYLFALVLVVSPLVDLGTTVWPPRMPDLPWRYGFLGLAAGYLHTPILGLVLGTAVAYWTGNRPALRGLGALMLAGAVVLLGVMATFLLDVLQMSGLRAPDEQTAVLIGGVIQEAKYGTACLVLGAFGYGTWKSAPSRSRGSRRGGSAPLISTPE